MKPIYLIKAWCSFHQLCNILIISCSQGTCVWPYFHRFLTLYFRLLENLVPFPLNIMGIMLLEAQTWWRYKTSMIKNKIYIIYDKVPWSLIYVSYSCPKAGPNWLNFFEGTQGKYRLKIKSFLKYFLSRFFYIRIFCYSTGNARTLASIV